MFAFGKDFIGVFAADRVPQIKHGQMLISNLDESDQPGSHWIGVAKDKKGLLIYDSFGRKSNKIIPHLYSQYEKIIDTEYDKEQDEKEYNCGARALAFLMVYYKKGFDYAKWI